MIKTKVSTNFGGESPPQNGPAGNPGIWTPTISQKSLVKLCELSPSVSYLAFVSSCGSVIRVERCQYTISYRCVFRALSENVYKRRNEAVDTNAVSITYGCSLLTPTSVSY